MKRPVITLLTDFGLSDHYVAAMKGTLLTICPDAHLIDISHEVAPYRISEAAYTLSQAWNSFPQGSIHVVVIDPGVGSSRRPILVEAAGHRFVAPDNGVLTMVLNAQPVYTARHVTAERYFRPVVSQTFHGRDIFAPVAGHLAMGVPARNFGEAIHDLVLLPLIRPVRVSGNRWNGIILKIDHFGNIVTNFDWESFRGVAERPFELAVGEAVVRQYHLNYAACEPGELFVVNGSGGFLEVSLNQEDAAKILGVGPGEAVEIRWV